MRHTLMLALILAAVPLAAFAQPAVEIAVTLDPRCTPLALPLGGPFGHNDDGSLMTVDKNVLRTSTDGGKTWSEGGAPIDPGMNLSWGGHVGQFLRTKNGTLLIAFLDMADYKFDWDNARQAPNPGCKLELWAIRSTDGGKTWSDKQRLLDGYNADFMGFLQMKNGRIVLTAEHLVAELRRWVSCSFVSDDEGKTWAQGNWIDLGGHGHHDGAVEPMAVELNDGRVMMLIRTNLDRFWAAYSDDGRYFRTIQPTDIDASSAPGWLARLKSGRLVLAWNRLNPEGKTWPKRSGEGPASEFPASWFREELSIAFSEDDGKTWTAPVVAARAPGGSLAYPYIFENTPGTLWVFTHYGEPRLSFGLNEMDFLPAHSQQ